MSISIIAALNWTVSGFLHRTTDFNCSILGKRGYNNNNNFGLGSSSALLPPGSTSTSVADARGLLYNPRISNHSYPGRQVPLASTTRGSPLAARGGTMGGNGCQMMPGIRTQGSLTRRKSATWDL
jgi:hypothetical protein